MAAGESDRIDAYVWRISAVVIVGSIMSILDTTIVNVALDTLRRELHSTIAQIQWVVTGYLLALAAVIPVTGWAAKRFGAKHVYVVSLIVFTAGSALCGLATSTTELIAFRVLQGVGGGMILPIGQLMMAEAAGPKRMGRVMSIVAVPAMLAPILGPTIGGLILENASWQWIFYVNVPIGVIAVVAALRILPNVKSGVSERLDVVGLVLLAVGLPLLTYGLAEIASTGTIGAAKVIGPAVLGLGLIAAFCFHALRIDKPLLDLRLYRRRTFSSASIAMFCLGGALFGGMILLPFYWQQIRLESVVDTGLLTAPQGLGMALVMPLHETLGLGPDAPIRWISAVERGLTVEADYDQLFRILLDLSRNAVQALESRDLGDPGRDQIRITGRREGAVVVIEVSDTGPGFYEKARAHLFEAFQGRPAPAAPASASPSPPTGARPWRRNPPRRRHDRGDAAGHHPRPRRGAGPTAAPAPMAE